MIFRIVIISGLDVLDVWHAKAQGRKTFVVVQKSIKKEIIR